MRSERILLSLTLLIAVLAVQLAPLETSGGIVRRGTINFIVSSDSAGRHPITNINWGKIAVGVKNTRTFYIVNKSNIKINCIFTLENWNWQTTNPGDSLLVNIKFSATTPLLPNQSRKVTVEQTLLKPIISQVTYFRYDIVITGKQAK